jgi:hypothetical protein
MASTRKNQAENNLEVKSMKKIAIGYLLFCFTILSCQSSDQSADTGGAPGPDEPLPSTKSMVMQTIGTTDVTVEYHSPAKRNRVIFGELVPYGELWRAGANDATTVEFSGDVLIQGERLDAGKYGLWIIPEESGEWTLIFSSASDVPGTPYPEGQDALRVTAQTSQRNDVRERMEFYFPEAGTEEGVLSLTWDSIRLPITIRTLENDEEAQRSLHAAVMNTIMMTEITVNYHRPAVRNRVIYGELVPFDEPWRAGANNATTIEISKDVLINSQSLSAGLYGFWVIPGSEGASTLIFSSANDVWGIPYPEGDDLLRVEIESEMQDGPEELLEYVFAGTTTDTGVLSLIWNDRAFPMKITAK